MSFFNQTTESHLNVLLHNTSMFKLIILWGEKGNGKTFIAQSALQKNHIKTKDIIFSEENMVSFEQLDYPAISIHDEDAILIKCSQLFLEGYCMFFQNMEFCDLDSQRILYRLLRYHKNNNQKASVILEYNIVREPDDMLCSLSKDILFVGNLTKDNFYEYYAVNFASTPETQNLFEKILKITNGNIHNFLTTINILQYMDVLNQSDKGIICNESSTYKIPNNLLDLYIDLFDELKDYMREPLISTAPFSEEVYSTIIRGIYHNYDNFEEYLKLLCEKGCFILENTVDVNKNSQIFLSHYSYSDEYARKAVIARIDKEKAKQIVSKYYNHLDNLYSNKRVYNKLQDTDKILLLSKLAKKRQNTLKINQIYYITELMQYYYNHFMYLNVIKQGENLLAIRIVNNQQLNDLSHQFWVTFFKALLAVGNYEKVLGYKGQFEDEDLNYHIAVALYNYGRPADALELLENELSRTNEYSGYVYNLAASIYDWLGDNKKSLDSFKKALTYADDDRLKYQLYKKYSLYIDFRIQECRDKMKNAVEYYELCNLKQYAECLHNYGTGCVMIKDFSAAEKYLKASANMLNKICANEIYYPLNSLAILYCYNDCKYKTAISILRKALKCDINVAFCELAIHNNLFNIGIVSNDTDFAKTEKNILETLFKKECNELKNIPKERPDIQHQLRQFYYNCALLCKMEKNDGDALKYFLNARECSTYHSIVLYSIERNIVDLRIKTEKKSLWEKIKVHKNPAPTELEQFIYENDLYLCEIMFWG